MKLPEFVSRTVIDCLMWLAIFGIAFGPARAADLTVQVCGQTMAVTCGTGPGPIPPVTVAVPNVVGQSDASARSAIAAAGLSVGAVTQASSTTVLVGNVLVQNPAGGSQVTVGTQVSFVTSSGPGAFTGVCPGFTFTRYFVENWADPQRLYTSQVGGFGQDDIVVVQFTTGNTPTPPDRFMKIAAAEYQGIQTRRIAALSDKPCDFAGLAGAPGSVIAAPGSPSVTVPFTIQTVYSGFPNYYALLKTNTTYFFNIRMAEACSGSCDIAIDLLKYGLAGATRAQVQLPLKITQPAKHTWPSMQKKP